MRNLKEAIAKNKLKQFVKERENEPPAYKQRFDDTLTRMIKNQPVTQEASIQDSSGSYSDRKTPQHKKKDT